MARLTRQQMKRDEILDAGIRFYHYITDHTRVLVFAGIAVVALALAAAGVIAFMQGRQERANALFAQALSVYDADVVTSDADPDDPLTPSFASEEARDLRAEELFRQLESGYGGTSVGRIAGVYLGRLDARGGDTTRARERWEEFIAAGDDHMLAIEVRLNLLALDRAEGRGEEVAARLEEQVASERSPLPLEVALQELALTLEDLGRDQEARSYYQQIVDEFPSSPYAVSARQKLLEL